jgi:hypothetical protein
VREVGQGGLGEEQGPEDVDAIGVLVGVDGDVLEQLVDGDAGVVDEDVDLEGAGLGVREVVLGRGDEVGWAGGVTQVGLDDEGGDAVLFLEGFGELGCEFGGGV